MWTIDQAKPRHWALDLLGVLSLLAPSERPHTVALVLRVAFVLGAVFAVDVLIEETGGLPSFYTNLYYILLMYAGLSLPLPLALGVAIFAIVGPSTRGMLLLESVENHELGVLTRPVAMGGMVLFAGLIARAIRRNVTFYERLYESIATHFPNGTISLFDQSLRFLISGGEGLKQMGLSPDQIVGKQPWDVFDAQGLEKELPAMHAALTGEASAFEMKFEGRDRLVRMTPLRDGGGKVIAGLAIAQDITDLRLAEAAVRESERRTFTFLDSMPVGVFVLDANGRPYYSNRLAKRLLGLGIEPDATGVNLLPAYKSFRAGTDKLYPDSMRPIVRALTGKTSMIDDMELDRPDGRMSIQVWGAPIQDEDGRVAYALAAFSDITAQKRFEKAVRESEERFRAVFEESPLGIFLVDTEGRFIRVNEAFCRITGYGSDELLGHPVAEITYADDLDIGHSQRELLIRGEITHLSVEKRYVRKDGGIVWVGLYSCMIRDDDGAPLHALAMAEDITARREMEASIQHLAYHDPLTGLPNRRLMLDRIDQAITRIRRYGGEIALLSLDLDGFKDINDDHGHAAGDAFLVETSRRLESVIRASDTVARMGGDEFLVLLTEATSADAEIIRGRIVASLARPVVYEGIALVAPVSIGVAVYARDGCDTAALIKSADAAMYADKRSHPAVAR